MDVGYVEIGLGRFSGMKDMYRSTLSIFHKKLLTDCNNMATYLDAKALGNFAISVHTMKSSLATVGAMRLSETALELETASKGKEFDFCAQRFPAFKEELLSLHNRLSDIFPLEETLQEKEPGDMDNLRESVQKALAAANDFNNDTGMEIIGNLLHYDFGGDINVLLENSLTALENFEFENAAGILERALEVIE